MKRRTFIRDRTGEGYVDVAISLILVFVIVAGIFLAVSHLHHPTRASMQPPDRSRTSSRVCGQADEATLALAIGQDGLVSTGDIAVETDWHKRLPPRRYSLKRRSPSLSPSACLFPILRPVSGSPPSALTFSSAPKRRASPKCTGRSNAHAQKSKTSLARPKWRRAGVGGVHHPHSFHAGRALVQCTRTILLVFPDTDELSRCMAVTAGRKRRQSRPAGRHYGRGTIRVPWKHWSRTCGQTAGNARAAAG